MPTFQELVQTLGDTAEPSYRRRAAARSLAKLGEPRAVEPLLAVLSDGDRYVCRAAAQALGKLGDAHAVAALAKLLADPDTEVRRDAANALGDIGDASAVPALNKAAKDPSFSVGNAAQKALDKIGSKPKPAAEARPAQTGPRVDVQALMSDALEGTQIKKGKHGLRYSLTVPLPGGRSQKVAVSFDGRDDDGSHLVVIHSVCGPADAKLYRRALRTNTKLSYGALAIAEVDGKDHFVLVNTQLARTAQPLELRKSILLIAEKADAMEKRLTGQDVL